MRAAYVIARLLWRPRTPFLVLMAAPFGVLGYWTLPSLRLWESAPRHLDEVRVAFVFVTGSMAVGALIGSSVFELLRCPFATRLPGLTRSLRSALIGAGILLATSAGFLLPRLTTELTSGPVFAQALLWFAMGVVWMDPLFASLPGWRWWGSLLTIAPILTAPELARAFEERPWSLGLSTSALGLALLACPLRQAGLLLRSTDPACRSVPGSRAFRSGAAGPFARSRSAWSAGGTLRGTWDWTRAVLHEAHGHVRGGWVGSLFRAGLGCCAFFVAQILIQRVLGRGDPMRIDEMRHNEAWIALFFVTPMIIGHFLVSPFRFTPGWLHPLSRREHAAVAWWASAAVTFGTISAFALVLFLYAVSGPLEGAFLARDLPPLAYAVLTPLLLAPLAQAVGLWLVEGSRRGRGPSRLAIGALAFLIALPGMILVLLLRGWLGGSPRAFLGLVAASVLASQALWRRYLLWHFRTRDLPA